MIDTKITTISIIKDFLLRQTDSSSNATINAVNTMNLIMVPTLMMEQAK